jgi:hypothetical protein
VAEGAESGGGGGGEVDLEQEEAQIEENFQHLLDKVDCFLTQLQLVML